MTTSVHNISSQDHSVTWPFYPSNFNVKEKDYESGFHYYGARYYWGEVLTGWLSVDPMADKYPNISPYQYCRFNPLKRIDIFGLFDTEKQAQRAHKKAEKRFGKDRVGKVYNKGSDDKPNYAFPIYGPERDDQTYGMEGECTVWGYRPDVSVSNRWGLFKYTFFGAEREEKLSVSITLGLQGEVGLSNINAKLNLLNVNLVETVVNLSDGTVKTNCAKENNAKCSSGVGLGIGMFSGEYNCSFCGGDNIDKQSITHTFKGSALGISTGHPVGEVGFGIGGALIFGIDIRLTSSIKK